MDLNMRYNRLFHAYSVPFGMGPKRMYVRIGDDNLRMGWGFRADIPLTSVSNATLESDRVVGWGWHGECSVNGSTKGVVRLTIDPPVPARVFGGHCSAAGAANQLGRPRGSPDQFSDSPTGERQ